MPTSFDQTSSGPALGHFVRMPFSLETLSAVGPRKQGQSSPVLRVRRSGGDSRFSELSSALTAYSIGAAQPASNRQESSRDRRIVGHPPVRGRHPLYRSGGGIATVRTPGAGSVSDGRDANGRAAAPP